MQKIPRNDPCPCGSHKKFKHCCLAKVGNIPSMETDIAWYNFREREGNLREGTHQFALAEWGPEIIQEGWDAFCLDAELERDSAEAHPFFSGWVIYRWIPSNTNKWQHLEPNATLADLYSQKNELRAYAPFLAAVRQSPFSFFFVEDVIPARQLVLRDLLLDRTLTVKEKKGSHPQLKGMIVLARLVSYENQIIQLGLGAYSLPLRYNIHVEDLKKELLEQEKSLTPTTLLPYDDTLRRAYFIWCGALNTFRQARNIDGDFITPYNIYYRLACSPKIAFCKLSSLCQKENPEELLKEGKSDISDELHAIQFPIAKNQATGLLVADVIIEGSLLVIRVNSMKRSKKIREEIAKRLPEAIFEKEEREPLVHYLVK